MTKEEILDNALPDVIEYPHYNLNNFQRSVALDAMVEYAKQDAINFRRWMDVRGYFTQWIAGKGHGYIRQENQLIFSQWQPLEDIYNEYLQATGTDNSNSPIECKHENR